MSYILNNRSPYKTLVSLFAFLVLCQFSYGQFTGPTNPAPNSTHTYTFDDGNLHSRAVWAVTGGTTSVFGTQSGTAYSTIVQWGATPGPGSITLKNGMIGLVYGYLSVTIGVPSSQTNISDENYVHALTPRIATTDVSLLNNDEKTESVTYFDGLGRAVQSIGIRAGGNEKDIIAYVDYDNYGRQAKDYLPYALVNNGGAYKIGALTSTNAFYNTSKYENTLNPYSEKQFEASPLNRVLKQAAPGEDWKLGNGHEIEFDYQTNVASEVRYYAVSLAFANNTYAPTLTGGTSYYSLGELYKTITKDENHDGTTTKNHTTEEFKDKQGRVILKRTYDNGVPHDTYYVYDDYGNLTYVLPPKAEPNTAKPDATELAELCYQYKYDHRNRLVEKKIPGKGWEYIVYNKLDQPILTQDANLKAQNKWMFTVYDAFGRVAYTGTIDKNWARSTMQNHMDTGGYAQYVNKRTSAIILNQTTLYYDNYFINTTYLPTTTLELHTINYYDNYTFDKVLGNSETSYGITPITNAKGLATGSKVRVLNSSPVKWITTVSYYDDKSRPIYTYSFNDYLGTTDKVKSKLDFVGAVDETTTTHAKTGQSTITNVDTFVYDAAGRLLTQKNKINALPEETIVQNTYDELGQLTIKGVGGKTSQSRLQNVDYAYNVRGWLKQINNPASLGNDLFGFKINYNTVDHSGAKLFNGNISETEWKTANTDNSLKWYKYGYDALNRITSATDNMSRYNLSGMVYDKNGNITNLTRKGHTNAAATTFGNMDILIYTYQTNGNKLVKVLDNANDTYGFKDGSNITTEYTYDANGNMTSDANKGITSITYNHLNLPTNVSINGGGNVGTIAYFYDAMGVKLKKTVSTGTNTLYAGNYVYEGTSGNETLKFFNHPEGYVEPKDPNNYSLGFDYVYQYKDHLGNIRLSYKDVNPSAAINVEEDFTSSTYDWSNPGGGSINNTNEKLNISITNKWNSTSKFLTITPNKPLHIEFDFEDGTMDNPVFLVRERINGVWEPGGDRDLIWVQNGHHVMDLTLTGDYIRLYFEKASATDDGTLTTCYVDNFKVTQNVLEIQEENNYYPFGLEHKGYNNVVTSTNPAQNYKYNGKEHQEELGLDWYDFGARNYDAALGRWMNIDPLAENSRRWTPYNFVYNNPLRFIDPDGMAAFDIIDVEKSTGEITVTEAAGDDIVRSVDNGEVKASYTYGENGSFNADNKIVGGIEQGQSAIVSSNIKKSEQFYEFAADNSDVEFGRLEVSKDDVNVSIVTTSFDKEANTLQNDLAKGLANDGYSILEHSHSHPGQEIGVPSGYFGIEKGNSNSLTPIPNFKRGDAAAARIFSKYKQFKNTEFNIYNGKTKTIYDGFKKAKVVPNN